MSSSIKNEFGDLISKEEYREKLKQNLLALKKILSDDSFGEGPQTIGAELELSIVNQDLFPKYINQAIKDKSNDPQLQLELNKYNLEYNLKPLLFTGSVFSTLERELKEIINKLNPLCKAMDSQLVTVGIIPTLQNKHVTASAITHKKRYLLISKYLTEAKEGDFKINVQAEESLKRKFSHIAAEGANNSFQIHLKVKPNEFADTYNALQIATSLAVAISANSPIFLEKILWDETRIALFKQAVDSRKAHIKTEWRQPNRVLFGYGWIRHSAYEIFAENVYLLNPLLPFSKSDVISSFDPSNNLYELQLHHSTIWRWNRPVYDPTNGGHLRIEMRCLPSGPTPIDMAANTAFLIGLVLVIKENIEDFLNAFPFMYCEYNFYKAAKYGLNAEILWPSKTNATNVYPIIEIIKCYLQTCKTKLIEHGIDEQDAEKYINIIKDRVNTKQTSAVWQIENLKKHNKTHNRTESCHLMFEKYIQNSNIGMPIHEWDN